MAGTAQALRAYKGPAFFSYGFRPFFFSAALLAGVVVPAWMAFYASGGQPFGAYTALEWHAHEMLFGFIGAVLAGFLLTAIPNWTGRLPVCGAWLAGLYGLWLAGRVAMAMIGVLGPVAQIIDGAFLITFAAVVWREVLAGGNMRNVPICVLVSLFALANVMFHASAFVPELRGVAQHSAIAVIATLITLVGGRIIPSFTRNWLASRGATRLPAPMDRVDIAALATTGVAMAMWAAGAPSQIAGIALALAALGLAVRLSRWCGLATVREPLLLVLHLGYGWLVTGIALLAAAQLLPGRVPANAGLHALLAGAVGVMVLGVMARASRGHTGRGLQSDALTTTAIVLVNLGALVRVAAYFAPDAYMGLLMAGGTLWSAGFLVFAIGYAPLFFLPRRPKA